MIPEPRDPSNISRKRQAEVTELLMWCRKRVQHPSQCSPVQKPEPESAQGCSSNYWLTENTGNKGMGEMTPWGWSQQNHECGKFYWASNLVSLTRITSCQLQELKKKKGTRNLYIKKRLRCSNQTKPVFQALRRVSFIYCLMWSMKSHYVTQTEASWSFCWGHDNQKKARDLP